MGAAGKHGSLPDKSCCSLSSGSCCTVIIGEVADWPYSELTSALYAERQSSCLLRRSDRGEAKNVVTALSRSSATSVLFMIRMK